MDLPVSGQFYRGAKGGVQRRAEPQKKECAKDALLSSVKVVNTFKTWCFTACPLFIKSKAVDARLCDVLPPPLNPFKN